MPVPWQQLAGLLVGASFGLAFVLVNAHAPLAPSVSGVLRVGAILALSGFLVLGIVAGRRASAQGAETSATPEASPYGRPFWLVVLGELVLLVGGLQVRGWVGAPEEINIAWIATIVGLHFVVLARVWQAPGLALPGGLLTLLGVSGLVLATTPALAWVPVVSGVLSGVTLLGCSLAVVTRQVAARSLDGQ